MNRKQRRAEMKLHRPATKAAASVAKQQLASAVQLHQSGRLAEAERLYRQVLEKKWKHLAIESESGTAVSGAGDDGHFLVRLTGNVVTSLEGAENPATVGQTRGLRPALDRPSAN